MRRLHRRGDAGNGRAAHRAVIGMPRHAGGAGQSDGAGYSAAAAAS
jgi:hypothetical protein